MIWHDIDQNSELWDNMRVGRVTASSFSAIMAHHEKGVWGKVAQDLAKIKAKERLTGISQNPLLKLKQFDRGHRLEPIAIKAYEDYTGNVVTNGGFYADGGQGCSPDGLIGKHGGIEIKSRDVKYQLPRLKNLNFDPSAKGQIQGNMLISGRKWWDFVSYCEDLEVPRNLFIVRVFPDLDYQNILATRLNEFELLINEEIKKLR